VSSPPHPRAPRPHRPSRDTGFQPAPCPVRRRPHSRFIAFFYLVVSSYTLALTQGCRPAPPPPTSAFRLNPPLRPISEVIAAINANNQKIPTLWATLNYSATVKDEKGQVHNVVSDDGMLLYAHPNLFHLVGKKEFVGTVFDMGANDREFWLELLPGANVMYTGTFTAMAHASAAKLPIPLRPDLVAEVLGVGTFNETLLKQPVPVMRYDGSTDSYVFLFARQGEYRWFAQNEIWYDRTTLRPRRMVFYNFEGIPKLDARLSADKPVQDPDRPRDQWPLIAGDFKLFFPDTGDHMEFTLKDVRLYRQGNRNTRFPNPASFQRPDAGDTRVINVTE
jgi:hypothetical protein